jgi:acyl transferase domain-containing protein
MSGTDELAGIAIIGMSCRFPGSSDPAAFWRNLRDGIESISFFTPEELAANGVPPELAANPDYVPARGILDDAEGFDAPFFGLSPREAERMDPQQRVFLECAWEALEHAGYDPGRFLGPIGIFAGASLNAYALAQLAAAAGPEGDWLGTATVNERDFLPARVAHRLNLRGPSISVGTACSTSLVAVHLACQSLLAGECDLALAGGVRIDLPQKTGHLYRPGGIVSPDGHCRAFSADAQGAVGGNGAGLAVLKRLAEAVQGGDTIYAVIKGSAVTNDGADRSGFTAPGVSGQAAAAREALSVAGCPPESIGYVEAHGTGTALGDPVEVAALSQAYRGGRPGSCALGSVKTNIGHLDTAAGIAGLLKTALTLHHGEIPPSLHFRAPNPEIDFAAGPFAVNTELRPWPCKEEPRGEVPRRAGVSSFGLGGTNAHVILEEAPEPAPSPAAPRAQLLVLSARSEAALEAATDRLAEHLRRHPEESLADLAATLQTGRAVFPHRRALVCPAGESPADVSREAAAALARRDPGRLLTARQEARERPVVFLLPGQGTQSVNAGRELYEQEPVFRRAIDRCAEILAPHLSLDLRALLYPPAGEEPAARERLQGMLYGQPAAFALDWAVAQLWISRGVRPQALLGHSLGEYAAACLAGVMELPDALELVALRSRLLDALPPGAMLAVSLPAEVLAPCLGPEVCLAAYNAHDICLAAGPVPAVEALAARLTDEGVVCARLPIPRAIHSPWTEPALAELGAAVARIALRPPRIPYLSNVTGTWITAAEATDPAYWMRHLRQPVRFSEGLDRLLDEPGKILLETGAGRTLTALASRHPRAGSATLLSSLPGLDEPRPAAAFLAGTLGRLWLAGAAIDWDSVHGERRRRLALPTYPFEHRTYRAELPAAGRPAVSAARKRPDPADWTYLPGWRRTRLAPRSSSQSAPRSWLLFLDDEGLGRRLGERLAGRGDRVITVIPGEGFSRPGPDRYVLDPACGEDYASLLASLAAQGPLPERGVYLWTVGREIGPPERALAFAFDSLVLLVQGLSARTENRPFHLTVVSTGVHEVTGDEELSPETAALLGPVRVAPHEGSGLTCRSIDVVLDRGRDRRRLADALLAEVLADAPDPVVALRGRHRWVPGYDPLPLPRARRAARLRPGGTYLITGGLGGIGLALAKQMARLVRPNLILVGRSPLPPPDEWHARLADPGTGGATGRRLRALLDLEEMGCGLLVASADVADRAAMARVVANARRRFGAIHGVLHAAGVPDGAFLSRCTLAQAAAVLRPKVQGCRVLEAVLRAESLDFFVLFSSVNSLFGSPGQAAYTAANAFLDAYAHQRSRRPERSERSEDTELATAINWDTWREVGMAAATPPPRGFEEVWQERMERALTPEEGFDVLLRVLAGDAPQVIVATADPAAVLRSNGGPAVAERRGTSAGSRPPRPDLVTPYAAPRDELERGIAQDWQDLIGFEGLGVHDDFFELGGNSLLALRLMTEVERRFAVRLPVSALLREPTIENLARTVGEHRPAAAAVPPR